MKVTAKPAPILMMMIVFSTFKVVVFYPVSSFPDHDHWGGTPPRSWARSGETYNWCAAVPTLFVFVLTATRTILRQDLTLGLAPSQHPCMQLHVKGLLMLVLVSLNASFETVSRGAFMCDVRCTAQIGYP